MFGWLRRRRLSDNSRRRLAVAMARSEEALIETHVSNVLDVIAAVGEDIPLDRILNLYLEALEPGETRSTIISRRVLARLEAPAGKDVARDKDRRRRRKR